MSEMQKELSMNFPFFEPQSSPTSKNMGFTQPIHQPQQPKPQIFDNNFQIPPSGDEEINILNGKSFRFIKKIIKIFFSF